MVAQSHETNETYAQEPSYVREYFGLISLGMLFLAVAIVLIANPFLLSDFRLWVEKMTNDGVLTRPPVGLITSAATLFFLIGLSGFIKAAIRLRLAKFNRRVFADVLSGVAPVSFAYLITLYGSHVITWLLVLAIEAAVCGVLLISYSIMLFVFFKER